MDLNGKEFKAFGKNIEHLSLIYGVFLIFWGLVVSFLSKSTSMTSYIPTYLGLGIVIFAGLSIFFPNKKKLYMHLVVILGVVVTFGGLDVLRGLFSGNIFENFWADLTKIIMLISGSCFIFLCIQSFKFARRIKDEVN